MRRQSFCIRLCRAGCRAEGASGAELPRGCRRFLDAKEPEGPGERRAELDEEALAAYDAAEIDGGKLSAAVVALLPMAEGEEGVLAAESGADVEEQLSAIFEELWAAAGDIERAVGPYRRDDATPDPEPEPEPEPEPVSLFDKSGALDLSVVEQVWLCFHETQRTVAGVRAQRVRTLRKMGESSMGLSRRKAVDQGEVYNKGDHRMMSRDRKVEDIAAVTRVDRTSTKLRTIYNNELQQVEPYRKAKMLHAHTFKITNCMPENGPSKEGNHPGILQNTCAPPFIPCRCAAGCCLTRIAAGMCAVCWWIPSARIRTSRCARRRASCRCRCASSHSQTPVTTSGRLLTCFCPYRRRRRCRAGSG